MKRFLLISVGLCGILLVVFSSYYISKDINELECWDFCGLERLARWVVAVVGLLPGLALVIWVFRTLTNPEDKVIGCVTQGFIALGVLDTIIIIAVIGPVLRYDARDYLRPPYFALNVVNWSPNGSLIAGGFSSGEVLIWDAATQKQRFKLERIDVEAVNALAWSPDSQRLATAGISQYVYIWDVTTGRQLTALSHQERVEGLAWSHDGTRLAVLNNRGHLQVWKMGRYQLQFEVERSGYSEVDWSRDDQWIIGVNSQRAIIRDSANGAEIESFDHDYYLMLVAAQDLNPGGTILVAGTGFDGMSQTPAGKLLFWDINLNRFFSIEPQTMLVRSVKWHPVSNIVAMTTINGTIQFWDVDRQERIGVIESAIREQPYGPDTLLTLDWNPDGTRLAYGGIGGRLYVVDFPVDAQ